MEKDPRWYLFKTLNPAEAVLMMPETAEQDALVAEMVRLWDINNLGNCGTYYAEEFAKQNDIPYGVVEAV